MSDTGGVLATPLVVVVEVPGPVVCMSQVDFRHDPAEIGTGAPGSHPIPRVTQHCIVVLPFGRQAFGFTVGNPVFPVAGRMGCPCCHCRKGKRCCESHEQFFHLVPFRLVHSFSTSILHAAAGNPACFAPVMRDSWTFFARGVRNSRKTARNPAAHGLAALDEEGSGGMERAAYRINPGRKVAIGGNSMTRARAMMLMSTKGMTPR